MGSVIPSASYQAPVLGDIARQGKEEATKLKGLTRSSLMEQADSRKAEVAGALKELAKTLDGAANKPELAPILGRVSGVIRRTSSALESNSSEQLLAKGQQQFRARPGAFLAGLFALGFLAGRVIRD